MFSKKSWLFTILAVVACTWLAQAEAPVRAVAVLRPTKASTVSGMVWFTQEGDKVRVVADVSGLTPGEHGFHVHEYGDATSDDGTSAGGHYNPMKMPHAAPAVHERHEGDLGNLVAGADGKAHLDVTDGCLSLVGANSIIGRSVVVHANPDDLKTQPSGNAGPRIGVGVIGLAAPPKP